MNIHCPRCEALNREDDMICSQCGRRLRTDPTSPAQSQPPETRPPARAVPESPPRTRPNTTSHQPILYGVAVLLFFLAFAGGLALGLNIHPPDQHELEKGYKLGYDDGTAAGYERGKSHGETEGRQIGLAEARDEASGKIARLQDQVWQLRQARNEAGRAAEQDIERRLEEARQEGHRSGVVVGENQTLAEAQRIVATMTESNRKAVVEADKAGYERGLSEKGYAKGHQIGLELGLAKGKREALRDIDRLTANAADAARRKGYDAGKRDGIKEGEKRGKALGKRLGIDEGYRSGYVDGHRDGRLEGWTACGCK